MHSEDQTSALQQQRSAHQDGEAAGADQTQTAADVPYGHDEIVLRTAWLDGFSKGRISTNPSASAQTAQRQAPSLGWQKQQW